MGVGNRPITGGPHLLRNTARIRAKDGEAGQAMERYLVVIGDPYSVIYPLVN